MDIPDYICNSKERIPVWCWTDFKCKYYANKLNELRRVRNWIPYNSEQTQMIETMYNNNELFGDITIGSCTLTIKFDNGLGDRTLGYQVSNSNRKHFIKRNMLTLDDYKESLEKIKNDNIDLGKQAIGETDDCAICLEKISDIKCVLLPCKCHLIHAICCQTHLCHNGSKCPLCNQPTNIVGDIGTTTMHGCRY